MSRLSHELQEKIQKHLRTLQAQRKTHCATEETKRAAETAMTELTTIYSDFTSEEAFNAATIVVFGEESTGLGAIFHILFYPKLLMVLLQKLEENREKFLRLLDFTTDVNSGYGMGGTGEIFDRTDTLLFAATIDPQPLKLLLAAAQKASGKPYTDIIAETAETNFRQQTILHKAAGYGYKTLQAVFQVITEEAQSQATVDQQDALYKKLKFKALSVQDSAGNTPLHYINSVADIKMVLDDLEPSDQQTLLRIQNNSSQTPLAFAEAMLAIEYSQTTETQKRTTLPLAIEHLRSRLSIPAAASARAADDDVIDVPRSTAASARAADDEVIDVPPRRSTADSTAIRPVPVEILRLIEYIKKGNFDKLLSEQELFKSVHTVENAEIILSTVITQYRTKPDALVDAMMALMDIMPTMEVIEGGMKSMLALGLKALYTILESAELPPEELFALLSQQRATNSPNRDQFIRRILVRKRDHHFGDALIGRIFPRLGKEHLLATLKLESVAPTIFPVDNIPLLENRVRSVLSMLKTTDASYTEVMPLFHKAGDDGLILRLSVLAADSGIPAVALILEHYPLLVTHILADETMSTTVTHRYVQALTSAITHLPTERIFPAIAQELRDGTCFLHRAISTTGIPATLFTSVLQRLPVTLRQAALALPNSAGTFVIHAALANSAWRPPQHSKFLETILMEIPSSSLLSILRLRDPASRLTVMHYALGYSLEAATIHLEAIHKALSTAKAGEEDVSELFSMKTKGTNIISYLTSLSYGASLVSLVIGKYPFLSALPPPLTAPPIPSWAAAMPHAAPRTVPAWAAAAAAAASYHRVVEPNLTYEYTDIDITEILTARMRQEGMSTADVQVLTVLEYEEMLVPCISSNREVHPGAITLLIHFNPTPNLWLGILLEFSSTTLIRAIYINPVEIADRRQDPYFARARELLRPLLHSFRLDTPTTPILRGQSAVESGPYVIENLLSAVRRRGTTPDENHAAVRLKQLKSLETTSPTAFKAFCVRQSGGSRPRVC